MVNIPTLILRAKVSTHQAKNGEDTFPSLADIVFDNSEVINRFNSKGDALLNETIEMIKNTAVLEVISEMNNPNDALKAIEYANNNSKSNMDNLIELFDSEISVSKEEAKVRGFLNRLSEKEHNDIYKVMSADSDFKSNYNKKISGHNKFKSNPGIAIDFTVDNNITDEYISHDSMSEVLTQYLLNKDVATNSDIQSIVERILSDKTSTSVNHKKEDIISRLSYAQDVADAIFKSVYNAERKTIVELLKPC